MYNNKDVWDFISKNKPKSQNLLNFDLTLFLGYLQNGERWITQEQYQNTLDTKPISWQSVSVSVLIDQQCVYQGTPTKSQTIFYQISDTHTADHSIDIVLSGLTYDHCPCWPEPQSHGGVALQITGTFEHIPLQQLMPKFGKYFTDNGQTNVATEIMGQNGVQRLQFTSPFYQWLHQRRQEILWQLTYPNGYQPT